MPLLPITITARVILFPRALALLIVISLSLSLPSPLFFSRSLCVHTLWPLALSSSPLYIRVSSFRRSLILARDSQARLRTLFQKSVRFSLAFCFSPSSALPTRVSPSVPVPEARLPSERNQSPCTKCCATPSAMRKLENAGTRARETRVIGTFGPSHGGIELRNSRIHSRSSSSHRWRVSWVRAIVPFPFLHPDRAGVPLCSFSTVDTRCRRRRTSRGINRGLLIGSSLVFFPSSLVSVAMLHVVQL